MGLSLAHEKKKQNMGLYKNIYTHFWKLEILHEYHVTNRKKQLFHNQ